MDKFKFATIKNVNIEVDENEHLTEIRIKVLNQDKPVSVMYMPENHYLYGDYNLYDDHAEVLVSKTHPVGTTDGDTDWDIEQVYPCPLCESRARENRRKALES